MPPANPLHASVGPLLALPVREGARLRLWLKYDAPLLLAVAEGAGCDLQVSMPPNPASVQITSYKERSTLTERSTDGVDVG